jgi:hypothetical protein
MVFFVVVDFPGVLSLPAKSTTLRPHIRLDFERVPQVFNRLLKAINFVVGEIQGRRIHTSRHGISI